MTGKYVVELTGEQRQELHKLVSVGTDKARKLTHARIVLAADAADSGPNWPDAAIAEALSAGDSTVARVRKRFCQEGLEAALHARTQANRRAPRLDGRAQAHLIALTCSTPPEGHRRWSLRLLADKMVELEYVGTVSHECIRQNLKKGGQSSPG